jgi:hypothetical protein
MVLIFENHSSFLIKKNQISHPPAKTAGSLHEMKIESCLFVSFEIARTGGF